MCVDNSTASMRDVVGVSVGDHAPEISQALQGLADESAQRRVDITNRLLDLGVQRAWASAPDGADASAHMLALMAQCLDKSGVQPTDISSSVARKAGLEALSLLAEVDADQDQRAVFVVVYHSAGFSHRHGDKLSGFVVSCAGIALDGDVDNVRRVDTGMYDNHVDEVSVMGVNECSVVADQHHCVWCLLLMVPQLGCLAGKETS